MPLNFDLAGKVYEPEVRTITAEEIAAYAVASGDENRRHAIGPEQIASPIFPVVPGLPLWAVVTSDPELRVDNPLMILHGEQEIVHHRPIHPGDVLTLTPHLVAVEDKGKGATVVVGVSAVDEEGAPINDQYATIFVRGGGSGEPREPGSPSPAPVRGDEVAAFSSHVDVGMPARYAEASGDRNPIHLDEAVARAVGLPGVINHGMGTLSLVTAGLVKHVAGGDPARLSRIKVRLTDIVLPGDDLQTTVWAADGEGFTLETKRPDGTTVMTGSLEVEPA